MMGPIERPSGHHIMKQAAATGGGSPRPEPRGVGDVSAPGVLAAEPKGLAVDFS